MKIIFLSLLTLVLASCYDSPIDGEVGEWSWQPFNGNIGDDYLTQDWSQGYLVNSRTGFVRQCTRGSYLAPFTCRTVVRGVLSDPDFEMPTPLSQTLGL